MKYLFAGWANGSEGIGGQLAIQGKKVSIEAIGKKSGLLSVPFIDAGEVVITASTENPNRAVGAIGVCAMSSGEVTIKGNTTITADDVILASG